MQESVPEQATAGAKAASSQDKREARPCPAEARPAMSDSESTENGASKARPAPVNRLNDLTAKEWIPETVSVWIQRGLGKGHEHAQIERQHPAPFSFQDVARLIRFFSKASETVLDPLVHAGSTLKAAAVEGRKGIGIELNRKYAKLARVRLEPNWMPISRCVAIKRSSAATRAR